MFNGVQDGGSADIETGDDHKDVAGRIFVQPFKNTSIEPLRGLGFGVAGTYGNQAGALRSFVTPGQQTFFSYQTGAGTTFTNVSADGAHVRLVPQAYYYWGPFGVFGEYAVSSQTIRRDAKTAAATTTTFATVNNNTWQVSASYVLTGEENTWKGIKPLNPFSLANNTWGAVEVAGRIGQLTLSDELFPSFATAASAKRASSWGAGLNWYLNRNIKVNLDYEQTHFRGGSTKGGAVTAQDEQIIFSRVQFGF